MGKDRANIFKLEEREQKRYKQAPFYDCFDSLKQFAETLKNDIETKTTPHVLLLEADFGMGKTFFCTRFTQYLLNEKIDAIYFSAWENDYFPDPFISFSKEIIKYINKNLKSSQWKQRATNLFQKIENVVAATSISFCGVQYSSKDLINAFKSESDPIIEFKKELKQFIKQIENKKLVIIVDELDRCRPDYAMKVLECIKHFFDVQGLFIIVPTNEKSLTDSITALYGITSNTKHKECYYRKFFDDERIIKEPTVEDYVILLKEYINRQSLQIAIRKKLITTDESLYNSVNTLIKSLAKYSHKFRFSIRQVKNFAIEVCRISNYFYEPVRVELLACLFTYNKKKIDSLYSFQHYINEEHWACEGNPSNQKGKYKIFKMENFFNTCRKLKVPHYPSLQNYHNFYVNLLNGLNRNETQKIKTLEELDVYLLEKETILAEIKKIPVEHPELKKHIQIIETALQEQKDIIKLYRMKYGSDENDEQRVKRYTEIVQKPETLYRKEE